MLVTPRRASNHDCRYSIGHKGGVEESSCTPVGEADSGGLDLPHETALLHVAMYQMLLNITAHVGDVREVVPEEFSQP